jgi:hypothetical protein
MRILSFIVVLMACFTTSALAQAVGRDQFNYQLALQQKSQQYVPPPLSPAERARCRLRRPALNAASKRACKTLKARLGLAAA